MDGPLSDGPDVTDARPATADVVDPAARVGRSRAARERAARIVRNSGILLAFIVLIVLGALQSEHFLTFENFTNVARQASIAGILGIGMTFVILTAGIDLSVGSILGIVAIGYAAMLAGGVPWPLAVLLALTFGAVVGAINGLGITRGGIQPFIMTLGMLVIARGVTLTYSDAKPIRAGTAAPDIAWIGTGSFVGLPVPFLLFMGIAALAWFTLKYTTFGRQVYAVGDNLEAARLSGIPTRRVIFSVYVISGLCADRGRSTGCCGSDPGRGLRARRDRDRRDRGHQPVRRIGRHRRDAGRCGDRRRRQQPAQPAWRAAVLTAHRQGPDHPRRRPPGAADEGPGGRQVSP
jgi:ribose/xylose/arabinose/galactoside ABC-type transport system permease subunit